MVARGAAGLEWPLPQARVKEEETLEEPKTTSTTQTYAETLSDVCVPYSKGPLPSDDYEAVFPGLQIPTVDEDFPFPAGFKGAGQMPPESEAIARK